MKKLVATLVAVVLMAVLLVAPVPVYAEGPHQEGDIVPDEDDLNEFEAMGPIPNYGQGWGDGSSGGQNGPGGGGSPNQYSGFISYESAGGSFGPETTRGPGYGEVPVFPTDMMPITQVDGTDGSYLMGWIGPYIPARFDTGVPPGDGWYPE